MLELRPVNYRIANLRGYAASHVCGVGDWLAIQFDPKVDGYESFCVFLHGVEMFADYGLLFQPLTAGIVWKPLGHHSSANRIEIRLDHEDGSTLLCRFRAVASDATVRNGPMNEELFEE